MLDVLHEDRFADLAPAEVYATLLDEGRYLCSERTMYRILAANGEVRERRDQLTPPALRDARAARHAPNQVWSLGHHQAPGPGEVDVLLPVRDPRRLQPLRRRLDGRAERERRRSPKKLIAETCERAGHRARRSSRIHADRGTSMTLQARRAAARRPRRHQDPLAAARLQRQPVLRGQLQDAQVPARLPRALRLHRGRARVLRRLLRLVQRRAPPQRHRAAHARRRPLRPRQQRVDERARVLAAAYLAHPERFVRGAPTPPRLPTAVWINKPIADQSDQIEINSLN